MKKALAVLVLALFVLLPAALVLGAASTTWISGQNTKVVTVPWVSDVSGDYSETLAPLNGKLIYARFIPSTGDGAPAADYDVYIKDIDFSGTVYYSGADCDSAGTTVNAPSTPLPIYFPTSFVVDNAGDTNAGTVEFYIEVPK